MPFYKAVILIAGPGKGTRFRPLSMDVPKPLFPVSGIPMVQHHIEALAKVKFVREVLLLGFFPATEMSGFVSEMNRIYPDLSVRYLQEFTALGTAGGIYHFRDQIRSGNPDAFFVLNGDICADFPLSQMMNFHDSLVTILATEATKSQSLNYGCLVEDKSSHSLLHYVEKPDTFISSLINCGVYILSASIFDEILQPAFEQKQLDFYHKSLGSTNVESKESLWLEQDVLMRLAGSNLARVFATTNWWSQVKTAGAAIYANRHYLQLYNTTHPSRLAGRDECSKNFDVIGDVFIHPTAQVHPTAVVGPNVSLGQNVVVGAGTRIKESIVMDEARIGDNSLVKHAVLGIKSNIGSWSRVEGTPNDPNPNKPFAKTDNSPLFNCEGKINPTITIVGCKVSVPSEAVLLNSVVLPHKQLTHSIKNEIVL